MIDQTAERSASLTWIVLLTVASTLTPLVFACATPFPSLAALAAVYMNRRDGVMLILGAWLVSQTIGFCFMGYPLDAGTALTGFAVGTAAVAGVIAAGLVNTKLSTNILLRIVVAYVTAFVAFKVTILLWAPIMGHAEAALSLQVMARQFVRNAAILAGLQLLYLALTAMGVPRLHQAPRVLVA